MLPLKPSFALQLAQAGFSTAPWCLAAPRVPWQPVLVRQRTCAKRISAQGNARLAVLHSPVTVNYGGHE